MKRSKIVRTRDAYLMRDAHRPIARSDSELTLNLQRLLLGLAQQLLPAGITPAYFGDLAAQAFVRAAARISKCQNGRVNSSRIAVITALRRAEVKRLLTESAAFEHALSKRQPRTERVVAGWRTDRRYLDRNGLPRRLPIQGHSASFASLVKAFAGDVPPRAVLDELRRLRIVRESIEGVELADQRRPRDRSSLRSIQRLMDVLLDGLEAASQGASEPGPQLKRIALHAADILDLNVMQERASTGANAFLEGLQRSLEFPTIPTRRGRKKMKHQLAVTVVVSARSAKHAADSH
jgi:hypothetical protein